jgi:hypothetical protein
MKKPMRPGALLHNERLNNYGLAAVARSLILPHNQLMPWLHLAK